MTQRLPNCKIIALTVTTPISAEVIKLISTRYSHCLRILKLSHLNTTRETQLNEDSLAPLKNLRKLRQLSLAWRTSPNMGPMAFAFLSHLKKLRKLSMEIYEKRISYGLTDPSPPASYGYYSSLITTTPTYSNMMYAIPSQDEHQHSNECWHCPYAHLAPVAKLTAVEIDQQEDVRDNHANIGSPRAVYTSQGSIYSPITSPFTSPFTSPSGSPPNANNMLSNAPRHTISHYQPLETSTQAPRFVYRGEAAPSIQRATSAGASSTFSMNAKGNGSLNASSESENDAQNSRRSALFQSAPGGHVKPLQTISTQGTHNPSPISILKILADLPELEELKLSNWRDFGPLFLLAPLTKITTLTIKGRPNDLMTDGASVADAAKHFLFLATLSALRKLTLAWTPPCLPQLTRLTQLDLSQAPNLTDQTVEDFSKGLLSLTALSLDGLASGGQLTNACVTHLRNLKLLKVLDLSNHVQINEQPFASGFTAPIASSSAKNTSNVSMNASSELPNSKGADDSESSNRRSTSNPEQMNPQTTASPASAAASNTPTNVSSSSGAIKFTFSTTISPYMTANSSPDTSSGSKSETPQTGRSNHASSSSSTPEKSENAGNSSIPASPPSPPPQIAPPWNLIDLRLNNTSVASIAPFAQFAHTLQHFHVHGCELLYADNLAKYLPKLYALITFRYGNFALAVQGGLCETLLVAFGACREMVSYCDRVIISAQTLHLLPSCARRLQVLELYNDSHYWSQVNGYNSGSASGGSNKKSGSKKAKNEVFSSCDNEIDSKSQSLTYGHNNASSHGSRDSSLSMSSISAVAAQQNQKNSSPQFGTLSQLSHLQSLTLTGEVLTSQIIKSLAFLPHLCALSADKVEENSSSAPKAIVLLVKLKYLTLQLTSSSAAAIWMKYAVTLPNLLHFDDGLTLNRNVPWATHRRLYLEWHPRAVKPNRGNNCIIS